MRTISFIKGLTLSVVTVLLLACQSDEKQTVGFYLTDAPANKDIVAVYVDIQSIKYSVSDESWIDLPMSPAIVDLLQFSNGQDTLLANIEIDAGVKIQQIRLILGDQNTIEFADGSSVLISTPSAQSSGLKLNVQSFSEVHSGYKVVIDFDASRSLVLTGNGGYILKPVIRAYIAVNSSMVFGTIIPNDLPTRVFTTTVFNDTIATVSDPLQNNYFVLHGLYSGTYNIMYEDLESGVIDTLKKDVTVVGGMDVNLGELTLK